MSLLREIRAGIVAHALVRAATALMPALGIRKEPGVHTSVNAARKSPASGVAGSNRRVPSTVRADRSRGPCLLPITCVEVTRDCRSKAQVSAQCPLVFQAKTF